jgi:hypothetical protein
MSKLKVQMKSKAQITNLTKKCFDIEAFWNLFDICLPAGRQGFWHLEFLG